MQIYCWALVYFRGGIHSFLHHADQLSSAKASVSCCNLLPSHNPVLGKACVLLKRRVVRPMCVLKKVVRLSLKKWVVRLCLSKKRGCQAHVCRRSGLSGPCSLQEVREFSLENLGIFSQGASCSYRALRLPVWPVVEALEGKWGSEGLLSREGAHFLGWDRHVGNEGL
jgi:hypothetical protein